MEIYLPIAEMSVQWLVILAMGLGVGFLSGMFGVGGGFLMTPLLVFYGIPSGVAVATTLSRGACNAAWLELIEVRKRLEAVFDLYSSRLESPGVEFRAHVVQLQGKARTWGIRVGRTAQVEDDRQRAAAVI